MSPRTIQFVQPSHLPDFTCCWIGSSIGLRCDANWKSPACMRAARIWVSSSFWYVGISIGWEFDCNRCFPKADEDLSLVMAGINLYQRIRGFGSPAAAHSNAIDWPAFKVSSWFPLPNWTVVFLPFDWLISSVEMGSQCNLTKRLS